MDGMKLARVCPCCHKPVQTILSLELQRCDYCHVKRSLGPTSTDGLWHFDPYRFDFIDCVKVKIRAHKMWHANKGNEFFIRDYPTVSSYVRELYAAATM